MVDLLVFQVSFTEKSRLEDAFAVLLDHEGVASCTIEADTLTARFLAADSVGGPLLERLYGSGGLRWCTRHAMHGRPS